MNQKHSRRSSSEQPKPGVTDDVTHINTAEIQQRQAEVSPAVPEPQDEEPQRPDGLFGEQEEEPGSRPPDPAQNQPERETPTLQRCLDTLLTG